MIATFLCDLFYIVCVCGVRECCGVTVCLCQCMYVCACI